MIGLSFRLHSLARQAENHLRPFASTGPCWQSSKKRQLSSASIVLGERELTEKILDAPLGTFSRETTDSAIKAIGYWCSRESLIVHSLSRADKLLQRLRYERATGNISVKDKSWAIPELQEMLFRSWLQVDRKVGAERAFMALEVMVKSYISRKDAKPTEDMFVDVMEKWLHVCGDVGAVQAANTLQLLANNPDLVTNHDMVSDWSHALLKTLSSIGSYESDRAVKQLLKKMEILRGSGWSNMDPIESVNEKTVEDFSTEKNEIASKIDQPSNADVVLSNLNADVVLSLSRSRSKERGIRSMRDLFSKICQQYEDGKGDINSDFIVGLSEKLLKSLKNTGRPDDAEQLLLQLEGRMKASQGKFPVSAACFDHVMIARHTDLPKVRSTFGRMVDYKVAGFAGASPTSSSFSIYLRALSKGRNAGAVKEAMDALELLLTLSEMDKSVRPDCALHFNPVLLLLMDAGGEEALTKACDLIYRILDLGIRPEAFTFTTILQAHMKFEGGDGEASSRRAERILDRIIAEYEGGNEDVRPNAMAFNSVIGALGRSGRADAVPQTSRLLEEMTRLGVEPNMCTYNTLLDVCARAGGVCDKKTKRAALEVAIDAMVRMRAHDSGVSPNEVTYTTLLKVYQNLVPSYDDRYLLARKAFQMCCADGLMSDAVLQSFRSVLPRSLWSQKAMQKAWTAGP